MTIDTQEALRLLDEIEDEVCAWDQWPKDKGDKLRAHLSAREGEPSGNRAPIGLSDRALWGVVANAGAKSQHLGRQPRWVRVMEATTVGSGSARELCARFGFNADELVPRTTAERLRDAEKEKGNG
jgi:hypothetical protein